VSVARVERLIGRQVEAFVLGLHDHRYMLHDGSVAYRAAGRCLIKVAVALFVRGDPRLSVASQLALFGIERLRLARIRRRIVIFARAARDRRLDRAIPRRRTA